MLAARLRTTFTQFPRQYWLMIVGIAVSAAGNSMIWPFLLIYATARLNLPLATVAPLISINAGTGLVSSFIAGTMSDRIGRKTVMNISLTINGLAYFFLMNASTFGAFAILMVIIGFANPMYQVGADAMLADMISSAKRAQAYAINRMASNAGFALGPAIGGFLATRSYQFAFYGATAGFLFYSVWLFFMARETLVRADPTNGAAMVIGPTHPVGGYGKIFRDKPFVLFISLVALGLIAPMMLWILLPVYAKSNFGLRESLYGWLPTTNAIMCVFVQFPVTQLMRRYRSLFVTAIGMLIYALGTGSVALMSGFRGFWLSMVVLTFGELMLVPTASKFVADLAPPTMRGRYMSLYWIAWGIARTSAPLIGGYLSQIGTGRAIWVTGFVIGTVSALGLLFLSSRPTYRGMGAISTQEILSSGTVPAKQADYPTEPGA